MKNERKKWPAILIIVLSLILIFIGYSNKEHASYFQKAVMICTECIGIG